MPKRGRNVQRGFSAFDLVHTVRNTRPMGLAQKETQNFKEVQKEVFRFARAATLVVLFSSGFSSNKRPF